MAYNPNEPDTLMQRNTFRRQLQDLTMAFEYIRAYWGRRLYGFTLGLVPDLVAEAATQAFYSRLPGHPQQAEDSLTQVGLDRDLIRFRGESRAAYLARIKAAWDDYAQAGTDIQVLRVVNQWGYAGFPETWDPMLVNIQELNWEFTLTIQYGAIVPAWTPEVYGSGRVYGETGFFYGLSSETDLAMLKYLVAKWKRSASKGKIRIEYAPGLYVTIVV